MKKIMASIMDFGVDFKFGSLSTFSGILLVLFSWLALLIAYLGQRILARRQGSDTEQKNTEIKGNGETISDDNCRSKHLFNRKKTIERSNKVGRDMDGNDDRDEDDGTNRCDNSYDNKNTDQGFLDSLNSDGGNIEDGYRNNMQKERSMSITRRKQNFLMSENGQFYGYVAVVTGSVDILDKSKSKYIDLRNRIQQQRFIDTWRKREFPSLVHPITLSSKESTYNDSERGIERESSSISPFETKQCSYKNCVYVKSEKLYMNETSKEDHDNQHNEEEAEVYLDYAGASLPSLSQLRAMYIYQCSNNHQILANPHSTGPAASRTSAAIEGINMRVLKFFGALPGFRYGYGCGEEGIDNHRITGKTSLHTVTNTDNKMFITDVNKIHSNGCIHASSAPDNIKTDNSGFSKAMKKIEKEESEKEAISQHPGYHIIFTSGSTEALKIIAESFPWCNGDIDELDRGDTSLYSHCNGSNHKSDNEKEMKELYDSVGTASTSKNRCQQHCCCSEINDYTALRRSPRSTLLYSHNVHTSVIGMREVAMGHGATFRCEHLSRISSADPDDFVMFADGGGSNLNMMENDKSGGDPISSIGSVGDNTYDNLHNFEEDKNLHHHCAHNDSKLSTSSNGENNLENSNLGCNCCCCFNRSNFNDECAKCSVKRNSLKLANAKTTQTTNHLLILPMECNFGGDRPDVKSIFRSAVQAFSSSSTAKIRQKQKWYTMLDIAKAASTSPINLCSLDPDFACLSFYKMFGAPTGLGALFVKRTSANVLQLARERRVEGCNNRYRTRYRYFGGGAVDVVLSGKDFVFPRSSPSPLSSLVHGTVDYRGILSLSHGFDELERVGGMRQISMHTTSLVLEFVRRLRSLSHSNGRPVVIIYGAWKSFCPWKRQSKTSSCIKQHSYSFGTTPGPTVAFNILRHDGTFVGYNEVSKLAALSRPPIQLRVGCFCNPGACQEALAFNDTEIQRNYLESGHVCGDQKDIINDKPTGAIRVSFGKESIWEDMDAFVMFVNKMFVCHDVHGECDNDNDLTEGFVRDKVHATTKSQLEPILTLDPTPHLSEIYVFPIKSCAAMRVKKWKMDRLTGSLLFDREFALVDSSGSALRLNTYPKMGFIQPIVDLEHKVLHVKAPDCEELKIDLEKENFEVFSRNQRHVKVCGSKCGGKLWGSDGTSQWFSDFLGVQCWLARHDKATELLQSEHAEGKSNVELPTETRSHIAFANEAPILLVSQDSVEILNSILAKQRSKLVQAKHFRPNLVVSGLTTDKSEKLVNPEDLWSKINIPRCNLELAVIGPCARCSMVDVDASTGMKGKTMRALAEYRRKRGQITFGVFCSLANANLCSIKTEGDWGKGDNEIWIEEGEAICVEKS